MINEENVSDSWNMQRLEDLAESFSGGSTPSKSNDNYWSNGSINWATTSDYPGGKYIGDTEEKITQDAIDNTSSKIFEKDMLFVTIIGDIGRVAIVEEPMAVNQQTVAVKLGESIDVEYAYYYIKFARPMLVKQGRGGVHSAINQSHLKSLLIPVPPLDEQERIVEAVEERLDKIERLEKSVENISRFSEEYRDSVLSYLVAGRELSDTYDISADFNHIPEEWEVKKLDEIGSRRSSMVEAKDDEMYSIYSFAAVDSGEGYFQRSGSNISSRKRKLEGGEVMISRLNPRINRVQMVDTEHKYPPVASSEFVVIDVESQNILPEYVEQYLRNPVLQQRLTNSVTGATGSRSRVGFDFVMDSKIPIPPKDKQNEIINQIDKVDFSSLDNSIKIARQLSDEYRSSVLAHAFQGEY